MKQATTVCDVCGQAYDKQGGVTINFKPNLFMHDMSVIINHTGTWDVCKKCWDATGIYSLFWDGQYLSEAGESVFVGKAREVVTSRWTD